MPQTLAEQNNNPGNLRFAGQRGATPGSGGFSRFDTVEQGYQALQDQIKLDSGRGHTLASYISKYAPPSENDTSVYIQQATETLGVDPGTPLSGIDIDKLSQFQVKTESGLAIPSSSSLTPGKSSNSNTNFIEDWNGIANQFDPYMP